MYVGYRTGVGPASLDRIGRHAVGVARHRPVRDLAAAGGPIGLLRDGDMIVIDAVAGFLGVEVPAEKGAVTHPGGASCQMVASHGGLG